MLRVIKILQQRDRHAIFIDNVPCRFKDRHVRLSHLFHDGPTPCFSFDISINSRRDSPFSVGVRACRTGLFIAGSGRLKLDPAIGRFDRILLDNQFAEHKVAIPGSSGPLGGERIIGQDFESKRSDTAWQVIDLENISICCRACPTGQDRTIFFQRQRRTTK